MRFYSVSTIILSFVNTQVIAPDDDLIAIGSGGNYALSAGRALKRHAAQLSASEMAYESF
jgi:ATP-dependent HslUV protease subunit HslV